MDYKGKKVWLFRVIPVVYSSNQVEWAVDVNDPLLNKLANLVVVKCLTVCAKLDIPVSILPRQSTEAVKNHSAYNGQTENQLIKF